MLCVVLIASLLATTAPVVPSLLTDAEPGARLRWRTLGLVREGASGAERVFRFEAAPPVVLRFEDLPRQCAVTVKRRFGDADAFADVPVPVAREGSRSVVVVPPAVGRADRAAREGADPSEATSTFVIVVPAVCGDPPFRGYQAVLEEDDKEGPLRVMTGLEEVAGRGTTDEEAVAWSRAEHPHRWQATLAELALLRRLLARASGADAAVVSRIDALAERARREAPWPDIQYLWHEAFELVGRPREVPTETAPFEELGTEQATSLNVGRAEALRLKVRLPLAEGEAGPVATRLGIAFDGRAPTVIPVVGGQDVEAPGSTRARLLVVAVPVGVLRVRLWSFDRPILLSGERIWRKRHLQERGHREKSIVASTGTRPGGALGAWLALDAARAQGGAPVEAAARAIEALGADARDELEREAARVLQRLAGEARAQGYLADGDAAAAVRTVVRGAASRVLGDEEAAWLADAQAFIDDDVSLGGHALAAIDGALARRPLDRSLVAAHARAFTLGAQWRRLSPREPSPDVAFLDPIERYSSVSPQTGAAARTRFMQIPPAGVNVEVPAPTSVGRAAVLTFLAQPGSKVALRTVTLDGRVIAHLPATSTLEDYDVAVPPGPHHVALSRSDGGVTWVDRASSSAVASILRRYTELGEASIDFALTELGVPATVQVSLRGLVSKAGAMIAPFDLAVETSAGRRQLIAVSLGAATAEPGGLASPWRATQPLELVVPLPPGARWLSLRGRPSAGARLFVHVASRARRSLRPSGPTVAGVGPANVATALGKARLLVNADEPLLAREAILGVLDDHEQSRVDRSAAATLWRELDEGPPMDVRRGPLSAGLCLAPAEAGPPPADTQRMLEVFTAARVAEADGALMVAAELWSTLAAARPGCAALSRQAALTLLAADPGAAAAARAHALLMAVADAEPNDVLTARAVRAARRRTHLRFLPFAERSAGSFLVETPRGEVTDATEPAPLAWPRDDHRAGVVGRDRELTLSFAVTRPSRATLRVSPLELRPRTAEATAAAGVALTWTLDGASSQTLPCAAAHECTSATFDLAPGPHLLGARLTGGVRPAARLWLDEVGPAPTAMRRVAYVPARSQAPSSLATMFAAEHLAATPTMPIQLTVQGPVVLRVELRRRPDGGKGGAAVEARPKGVVAAGLAGGGSVVREVEVNGVRDMEAVGPDVGAVSLPTVVELPLIEARPYAIEIGARTRLVLARVAVWEGVATPLPPPVPLTYVSRDPAPASSPLSLEAPPEISIVDGDVTPGHDDVGSLAFWTAASRLSTDPEGAPVQTVTSLHLGTTYRRLIERLHTTVRAEAAERLNDKGAPSQALSSSLFFIHPEHRVVRFGLDGDARTQIVEGQRAWSGKVSLLVEPVITIAPGLHLVSKLASWWSRRTLSSVPTADLPFVDPEVFSRYGQAHPRALAWEEGLEGEPFLNLVVYANARVTTNPTLRPNDLDHVSASVFARALFGRTYAEALGRTTWFLPDTDRARLSRHSWLGARFFQTLWPSERQMVELGVVAGYDFGTRSPEVRLSLVWEGSNGRRFGDHSPREGEDFFFAERGPGLGTSHLAVRP